MKLFKLYQSLLFFYSLLLFMIGGCQDNLSFEKVESEPTKLINGINSYQDIDQFKAFLNRTSLKWEITVDSKIPTNGKKPPFNIYTITINNYSHLGISGELNITFFNDRLMETKFYPIEVDKYIEALSKEKGIKFDKEKEIELPPHTRLRFWLDYKGRKYFNWYDIRLDKEFVLWIKRYD